MPVADDATVARAVGQIRMSRDMALDFRLNRLGKQLTSPGSQNIRQRIVRKQPWLAKCNNCICFHGVSLYSGNRRLRQRQNTPPNFSITKIRRGGKKSAAGGIS